MKKTMVRCAALWVLTVVCTITAAARSGRLVPVGHTVGIKLYSQGLIVTGFDRQSPAKAAGMKKGDVIIRADGAEVHTAEALRECLDAEQVTLTCLRKGRETAISIRPLQTVEGGKMGAYIRDSISGIGTITYYDPDTGTFGALGHGVTDLDVEALLPLDAGVIIPASVTEVETGKRGDPGALKGKFDVHHILGSVKRNTELGIFGTLEEPVAGKPLETARFQEIKPEEAVILANVDGTSVQQYSVEILKIYPHASVRGRDLLLQITDERLLSQTGGIVQGMSGSPIIQDGKLVGAVTHVCVT